MDNTKALLNLPRSLKVTSFCLLTSVTVLALYAVGFLLTGSDENFKESKPDLLLVSLAVIQISASALVLLIVLLYSSKNWSSKGVEEASETFFQKDLTDAFKKISFYEAPPDERHCKVILEKDVDIFGSVYNLSSNLNHLRVWIGLNVNRIFVIFWIDLDDQRSLSEIETIFKFTFGGAEKLGYSINYELAHIPVNKETQKKIVSIWSTVKVEDAEFLASPSSRLFWAQDIAMMIESFWRTAKRNNVSLSVERPAPL